MTKVKDLYRKWMENDDHRKAYEELAPAPGTRRAAMDGRGGSTEFPVRGRFGDTGLPERAGRAGTQAPCSSWRR
jgi:hypothetical protein